MSSSCLIMWLVIIVIIHIIDSINEKVEFIQINYELKIKLIKIN